MLIVVLTVVLYAPMHGQQARRHLPVLHRPIHPSAQKSNPSHRTGMPVDDELSQFPPKIRRTFESEGFSDQPGGTTQGHPGMPILPKHQLKGPAPRHVPNSLSSWTCHDSLSVKWAATYTSDLISPMDYGRAISHGSDKYIYVTGESDSDYLTIKYDSSGHERWIARYNGPGNYVDCATDIAVDSADNVYVTGYSYGSGTSYDYATVKYDSSGVQKWIARYNGSADYFDFPTGMVLDASANIYVTGYSWNTGSLYDYVTVKYNSSGVQQWVARYDGGEKGYDYATGIAIDTSGNVYVTGYSYHSGVYELATVKYDSSGVQKWVSRYGNTGVHYHATAIALDSSGNVYVTGNETGFHTTNDFVTVKYNSAGVQQWVARGPEVSYNTTTTLAMDASANIYVTGYSYETGYPDFVTVKYDSAGNQEWIARYNGPGGSSNYPSGIALDQSGNVYVVGSVYSSGKYTYATLKYSSSGVQEWVARYDGIGNDNHSINIVMDASANIYVTGYGWNANGSYDYETVKYDSSGLRRWVALYDGPKGSLDYPTAAALDDSGNVYITGQSYASATGHDFATVKYSSAGELLWAVRYDGPGNDDDATAIAVDYSGNVYVTGSSSNAWGWSDYVTVKYNSSGVQQWVALYDGDGMEFSFAESITLDETGNVYVTGSSLGSRSMDYATVKYNPSGIQQWVARYNGPGNSDDYANAVAVDGTGDVYVTGGSWENPGYGFATVKYNSNGVEQWVSWYDYPGFGTAIVLDQSGNIYVTGSGGGSVWQIPDYVTIKYNPSGVRQWAAQYNDGDNSYDYATGLAVNASGDVYVTGYSGIGNMHNHYTTVKYNMSGTQMWVARYSAPGDSDDYATAVQVDRLDNVYVTGGCRTGEGYELATVKYNSSGVEQWVARYNEGGSSADSSAALAIDRYGTVYAVGHTALENGVHYTMIAYKQAQTAYPVQQGWNLVSIPKNVSDPSRAATFSSSISCLYAYSSGYVPCESLKTGRGYWLRFPADQCISIDGQDVVVESLDVVDGWNLVGSLSVPIYTDQITSDPPVMVTSRFFEYDKTYTPTDVLDAGKGYWVKVSGNGKLILSFSGTLSTDKTIRITSTADSPPSPPDSVASSDHIPTSYSLLQSFPNPFNPTTTISYELPTYSHVSLKIYDVLGQLVANLIEKDEPAGSKEVNWNAAGFSSGIYLYRIDAVSVTDPGKRFTCIKKMTLMR